VAKAVFGQQSYPTPGPVSTWLGNRRQMGKPSRYVTSLRGQLSLAIPLCVSTVSTSDSPGA